MWEYSVWVIWKKPQVDYEERLLPYEAILRVLPGISSNLGFTEVASLNSRFQNTA